MLFLHRLPTPIQLSSLLATTKARIQRMRTKICKPRTSDVVGESGEVRGESPEAQSNQHSSKTDDEEGTEAFEDLKKKKTIDFVQNRVFSTENNRNLFLYSVH